MSLEALCTVDVLRKHNYSGGMRHHVLYIAGLPAQASLVSETFPIIRRTLVKEVPWSFWHFDTNLEAYFAVGAVLSFNPMQILVEQDVAHADLRDKVSLPSGEGVSPLDIGF